MYFLHIIIVYIRRNPSYGTLGIGRGVIRVQGDIVSPVLFITTLDQLVQKFDHTKDGVKCGRILKIRVLGYADDVALAGHDKDT